MSQILKISNIDHIIKRPTMYFGDFDEKTATRQLFDLETGILSSKKVTYSPAIVKLFDEALTNATDNIYRSKENPTTKIFIKIDDKSFEVNNNGQSISLGKSINPDDGKEYYSPELAFGHTYSSGNYDDEVERKSNGMNGIGIKLANVYSKQFVVKVINNNKLYQQTFFDNMRKKTKPKICDYKFPDGVSIKAELDFKLLNCSKDYIDDDTKKILYKRILDSTLFPVDIYVNKKKLPRFTFQQYFETTFKGNIPTNYISENTYDHDIIMFPFKGGNIVSMVNRIVTESNGTHVKCVIDKIIEHLNSKGPTFTRSQIESNLCLYLNVIVDKPSFTSQSKETFNGKINVNVDHLVYNLCSNPEFLDLLQNKRNESINRKLKKTKPIFQKLTEANLAGTNESQKCTLFVTEGDSATGMVQQCFSSLGHDYYGIYTLGGKPLNIRKKKDVEAQMDNRVISELIVALGIERGVDYSIPENRRRLRYGKLVCVKDADVDGSAIMMLVCNIIDVIAQSLLKSNNFFYEFITPQIKLIYDIHPNKSVTVFGVTETIVKGQDGEFTTKLIADNKIIKSCKNVVTTFNNKAEFCKFMNYNRRNLTVRDIKYYKGLAAISTEDALDYWQDYEDYLIPFIYDNDAEEVMENLFSEHKSCVNWRKQLVQETTEDTYCVRIKSGTDITQYGFYDYAPYAREDCIRTIPNVYDGLKPVQRKILYSLLIHTPSSEKFKKVFQIATQASLDGNYHHGDASINEATCGMMQTYMGSNNIPLITGSGQIGTRFAHGQDHGATRYIEGALSKISKVLFPKVDDALLKSNIEDEVKVEPKHYIPILPMVLINGTEGIGVGYSTFIPNHDFKDCIRNIREVLNSIKNDSVDVVSKLNEHQLTINPSYPGFKGSITYNVVDNCYETHGLSRFINIDAIQKNRHDTFWRTTLKYDSQHPELKYEHAFIEIYEIPIDSKLSMNTIISELKKIMMQLAGNVVSTSRKTTTTKKKVESISDLKVTSNVFNKANMGLFVDYQDNSHAGNELQDEKISLIIKIRNDGNLNIDSPPEIIRMRSSLSMRNMMLYSLTDNDGLMLRKFNTIKDIFNEYFTIRYKFYKLRKDRLIFLKQEEIKYLQNKINFIKAVAVDKILNLNSMTNEVLEKYLIENKYDKKSNDYKYLYSIPMRNCTKTEYEKLLKELEKKLKELEDLKNTLIKTFWEQDLNDFEIQQNKLEKELIGKRNKRMNRSKK